MMPRLCTAAAAVAVPAAMARPAAVRMLGMRSLATGRAMATPLATAGAGTGADANKLTLCPSIHNMNMWKREEERKENKNRKRNLLLTFDAFGTLYRPRPIGAQYGEVARACGLAGFDDAQLLAAFRVAYKRQAADFPNFGHQAGMGATRWWTEVVHATFRAVLRPGTTIPWTLAPGILQRYASAEAYDLTEPGLPALLRSLKSSSSSSSSAASVGLLGGGPSRRPFDRVVVGVITNSDGRVPLVLADLGFRVGPLRGIQQQQQRRRYALDHEAGGSGVMPTGDPRPTTTGIAAEQPQEAADPHDIDFCCISYEMGFEKPHPMAFQTAHAVLTTGVLGRDEEKTIHGRHQEEGEGEGDDSWVRIHVGDDPVCDLEGALHAGWNAVLLDATGKYGQVVAADDGRGRAEEIFPADAGGNAGKSMSVTSLRTLVEWLRGDRDSLFEAEK